MSFIFNDVLGSCAQDRRLPIFRRPAVLDWSASFRDGVIYGDCLTGRPESLEMGCGLACVLLELRFVIGLPRGGLA
jgi:hypothetical protein